MQMAHSLVSPRKSDAIVVVPSTMRSPSMNSNRPNHTPWSSSLSKKREDLLSHLRESRAKDVKMKTQLAEMIRCSLEECLAENEVLTDAITQLVEESKYMEDQYRILETEVIQLRSSNGTNSPKEQIQLVDSAAMKQENSNHHQRANHEWQKERKDLIEQIEQQQQEIKLLKSKLKRTKKAPHVAASTSQHSSQDVVSLDPDEYLKRFREKCNRGRSQSVEGSSVASNLRVDVKDDSASKNNENARPKTKRRGSVAGSRGRIKTEMPAERMQRTWHGGSGARDQMNDILNSKHGDSVPEIVFPAIANETDEKSNLEIFLEGLSPGVDPDSSGDVDFPKHVSKNEIVRQKGTRQDSTGVKTSSAGKQKGRNLQNTWHGGSMTDRGSIHRMLVGNPPLDERRHRKRRDERRGSANDIEAAIPEEPEFNDDSVESNGQPPRTQVLKRRSSASAVQFEKICKGSNLHGSTWHGGVEDRKKTMQMLLGSRKPSQEFEDESSVLSESAEDLKLKSLVETAKLNQSFSSPDEPGGIDGFELMPDVTMDKSTHSNFATGCDLPSRKASYSSILLENEDALFSECPFPASKDKVGQTKSSSLINNEHRPGRRDSVSSRSNILKKYKLLPKLGKQKKLTAELA